MKKLSLLELIERCIHSNWEALNPCEVFFGNLEFPEDDCDGNCAECLLKASGLNFKE
jgi:hypothetical protein